MARLVDITTGAISRAIYSDEAIYARELERIFTRCWLFVGLDCMIPEAGDYLTTRMGEEPIVLCRDGQGKVHAFLNTCRHRGNRVCLFEHGNTASFTCSYHGWSYGTDGKLVGVPFSDEAYYGDLDRSEWGLIEAPRLRSYHGMIFASWDPEAPSLEDHLGELRWYLDTLVTLAEDLGGFDVIATSRYLARGNWKIPAENFAGDHYHNPTTHGSSYKIGLRRGDGQQEPHGPFEIALAPGHGLGGLLTGLDPLERDLTNAERLGTDAVDYVKQRYARLQERLRDVRSKPYTFSHANVFPNLALWGGSAFRGQGFFLFQPRGPLEIEVWQIITVPKQAPEVVRAAALTELGRGGHFASGLFEQDDAENFERVTENTRSLIARRYPFHMGMGLRQEGVWPGRENWDVEDLPGLIGPRFSEHGQRRFYAYWSQLMEDEQVDARLH